MLRPLIRLFNKPPRPVSPSPSSTVVEKQGQRTREFFREAGVAPRFPRCVARPVRSNVLEDAVDYHAKPLPKKIPCYFFYIFS